MKPKIAFLVLFLISSLFLFSEAILWNGHYYEAILVTGGLNFDQANAAATSKGGYLVSITSDAENTFVYNLISNNSLFWKDGDWHGPWLGAFQPTGASEPSGGWQWTSGESFTYSNWNTGEPNNANGSENHVHFHNRTHSRWNDLNGGSVLTGYIVEYNSNPVPEPNSLILLSFVLVGFWYCKRH
ncbi:MAG: PEP-CTERM sorting domain-containing protein [Candidatus Brocadiae bacterium]|nr:PEP-CTERM sorting domain-containing protein [Candidatus Brocadiia bacterium]